MKIKNNPKNNLIFDNQKLKNINNMKNLILITLFSLAPLFLAAQTTSVKVIANGNVGIGTDNPTEKLQVQGNVLVKGNEMTLGPDEGFNFLRSNGGSSQFRHYGTGQYSFKAMDAAAITFWTDGSSKLIINDVGDLRLTVGEAIKVGGGAWTPISDERLKKNIQTYNGGIDELMQINPVTFQYNEKVIENSKEYVGVIAQEIDRVAPSMIHDFNLTDKDGNETNDQYMAVNPNEFTYMLINATKSQQDVIEAQEKTINEQQKAIETLQKQMASIQKMLGQNTNINESIKRNGQTVELNGTGKIATLEQNTPNPFNGETQINYFLPETAKDAFLQVFDNQGKLLQEIAIEARGNGQITLKVSDLPTGTYHYNLVVDGKNLDNKKMILK